MGNATAVTAGPNPAYDPTSSDPQMNKLASSLKTLSLSLRGRQLFSTEMEGGGQDNKERSAGEKRPRDEIPSGSLHKEIRSTPGSAVTFQMDKVDEHKYTVSDSSSDDSSSDSESDDEGEVYQDGNVQYPGGLGTVPSASAKKKSRGAWTPDQDVALRTAVEKYEGKNWKAIAREVPGNRSHIQCLQRWGKVLKPGLVKGPWTEEEDDILRHFVPLEARGNWVAVAEHVPGRTAKQCRERWSLCLDPAIRKDPWSAEEDDLLLHLHDMHGNAWATIAKHLPGRTENATKSRFKSIERKRDRAWTPMEDATIIRGKAEEKKWSAIAAMLPKSNRTKHAVKIRWKELMELNPALKRFDSSSRRNGSSMTSTSSSSFSSAAGAASTPMSTAQAMDIVVPPQVHVHQHVFQPPHAYLPPPIHEESSPPNSQMLAVSGEAMNENGSSFTRDNLPQSLSSDKLMNMRVQRNESFEEWLAKEAGGISALPMMTGGLQRSFSEEFAGPFGFSYEDLTDLDLV